MTTYDSVDEIVHDIEQRPVETHAQLYHPIPFPEFDHLTYGVDRASIQAKLDLVRSVVARRKRLGLPADSILDIGANGGLFTFSLAAEGARVTAYEPHPRYSQIGAALARLRAPSVDWHPEAFTQADLEGKRWDVAVLLSTFQWISRGDAELKSAQELLRQLSKQTGCLIFELGMNNGKSAVTTTKRNHLAAVHDLLRESTTYEHIRLATATRLWRSRRKPWLGWRFLFVCSHDDPSYPEPPYAALKRLPV